MGVGVEVEIKSRGRAHTCFIKQSICNPMLLLALHEIFTLECLMQKMGRLVLSPIPNPIRKPIP